MLNRSQVLILAFFAAVLVALIVIWGVAPAIYSNALKVPAGKPTALLNWFVVAIVAFVGLLATGVVRRWRWLFWLIVIAFLAGVLRVPAAILELMGTLPSNGPTWYVLFQAVIGVIQLVIGLALVRGYRRAGIWGAF